MIPLLFNLNHKKVLVVGGGEIGTRRIETLLENNGNVTCISLGFSQRLLGNENKKLKLIKKAYEPSDLEGMDIVIAATDNRGLNEKIKKACGAYGCYCNRVDAPKDSDFIFPGTIRQGNLSISVCTEGASPGLTKNIIKELKLKYDETYIERTELLKKCREKILEEEQKDSVLLGLLSQMSIEELREFMKEIEKRTGEKR